MQRLLNIINAQCEELTDKNEKEAYAAKLQQYYNISIAAMKVNEKIRNEFSEGKNKLR